MMSERITEHIPSWALKLPEVKNAVAQQQIDDRAARQELADKRAAGVRARQEMLKRHEQELKPLLAADQAAAKKLRATSEKAIATRERQMVELAVNEREEKTLTRALLATVDPRIASARSAMNARWDRDRPKLGKSELRPTGRYTSIGVTEQQTFGNNEAIARLLSAIKTARAAFDALKLATPDDVVVAIDEILEPVARGWEKVDELAPIG